MRKNKSSSGDTSSINPYMKCHVGKEVTTSKIKYPKGKPIEITIYQKVL